MYNLSQRFTALLLLFSITLQSCYTPLKMSHKKHSSTPKVSFNFGKSGKASTSNDSISPKIVQPETDWLQDEDDIDSQDNQDNEKQAIEYKKTEGQASTISLQSSSEVYQSQEKMPLISFYQKDGVWTAKLEETSGSLQRSEDLDVLCAPGIDVEELKHISKAQSKQLIHRIKHPKKNFIYLGKMGLQGGMMEEKGYDPVYQIIAQTPKINHQVILDEKLIEAKETSVNQAQWYYDNLIECKNFKNKDVARKWIGESKEASCFEELLILLASNNAIDYKLLNLLYDQPQAWIDDLRFIKDENIFNHLSNLYTDEFYGNPSTSSTSEIKAFNEKLNSIKKDRRFKKLLETAFTVSEDSKEHEKELIERLENISSVDAITTGKNIINRLLKANLAYTSIPEVCNLNLKGILKECSQPEAMLVKSDNIYNLSDSVLTKDHPIFAQLCAVQAKITQSKDSLDKLSFDKSELQSVHQEVIKQLENINDHYTSYIEGLCSSPVEKREVYLKPKILLQSDGMYRYMEESIVEEIFGEVDEEFGDLVKDPNMPGTCVVRKYGGLFFKYKPYAPGIEFMVSKLLDRIYLTAPTKLVNIKKGNKSYPFIVSKEVKGEDLGYFLKTQADEFLPKLDPKNFACLFFLSLLTNPKDGKEDNYFVTIDRDEITKEIIKYRIIGIDNDKSFVPKKNEGTLNVRSLLYFFPQMEGPIDITFREEFLNELIPEVVLLTWLDKLNRQNSRYESMLEEEVFSRIDYEGEKGKLDEEGESDQGLRLPIKLREGLVSEIYSQLSVIQEYMENNPELTYQELFEKISPKEAKIYQEIKEKVKQKVEEEAGSKSISDDAIIGKMILESKANLFKDHKTDEDNFTQEVDEAREEFVKLMVKLRKEKPIVETFLKNLLERFYSESKMIDVDSKAISTIVQCISRVREQSGMQVVPLSYEKLVSSLRDHYQKASFAQVKPWFEDSQTPLPIEKAQFQLLALEQLEQKESQEKDSQQEYGKEEEKSSQLSEYKQGSFQVEKPIELSDLFKPRVIKPGQPSQEVKQDVKKVLLVGEPGTGKTTVSHKLAYLWSKGQADQSLQTVYVVPVRELQQNKYDNNGYFKREETLATAITNICFPGINEEESYKPLRAAIKETLQQPSTLVVLDGLDEKYGASKNIISEAQKGNHKLLILSRPYGLEEVRKEIDLEVIHAGFTSEQLKAYIAAYFIGQEEKGSSLLQLIANNQMLKTVLHVPVNVCMVCAIWQSHEDRLRQYAQRGSLAELYEQMADYTWERYAEKMNQGKELKEMLNKDDKDKLFHALGCIALAGLEKGEVLISRATVRTVLQKLSRNSLVKAMLQDSGLLLFQEIGIVYQFPHLTFQEYFAGKELARRLFSKDSQEQELGNTLLSKHKYQSQYQVMLSFMAAEVSKKQREEGIAQVLRMLQEGPKDVVGVHQLILELRCLNEYLLLYPSMSEAVEKEFGCMLRLNKWVQQGLLEEVRMYMDRYRYSGSKLLISALQDMPAIAREAQGVLEFLLSAGGDKDFWSVHKAAIRALGELVKAYSEHIPAILPTLLNCAVDKYYWSVRQAAINALGELVKASPEHIPEILPTLLNCAVDKNSDVRKSALKALGEVEKAYPEHIPAMLSTLLNCAGGDKYSWSVREAAINSLGELVKASPEHIPAILPTLLKCAGDKDFWIVCQAALNALGEVEKASPEHIPAILPTLLNCARDKDYWIVRQAAIELVKASPNQAPEVLSTFIGLAVDKDSYVRANASIALGDLVKACPKQAPEVLSILLQAAGDKNFLVRQAVIYPLVNAFKASPNQGPAVVSTLIGLAGDKYYDVCGGACYALEELVKALPNQGSEVVSTLLNCAGGDKYSWSVRQAAINALGELAKASPEHIPAILPTLLNCAGGDKYYWSVRQAAINALGELAKASPEHIPAILPTLLNCAGGDKYYWWSVREAAIDSLVNVFKASPNQGPAVVSTLIGLTGDKDSEVRCVACFALEELVKALPNQEPEVLLTFIGLAGDKDRYVRYVASLALGELVKTCPNQGPAVVSTLMGLAGDKDSDVREAAINALLELVKASPEHIPEILPTLLNCAVDKDSDVREAAINALGELAKASPKQAPEVLLILLQAAGGKDFWIVPKAINALKKFSLMQFVHAYWISKNKALIPYILKEVYQIPLVFQDSKKGYQELVTYPTAGVPEVLGEYPAQEVDEFMQNIQVFIKYESEQQIEKIEIKNETVEAEKIKGVPHKNEQVNEQKIEQESEEIKIISSDNDAIIEESTEAYNNWWCLVN
jgi:HEAT repeat protein